MLKHVKVKNIAELRSSYVPGMIGSKITNSNLLKNQQVGLHDKLSNRHMLHLVTYCNTRRYNTVSGTCVDLRL